MSLHQIAKHIQDHGRGEDTVLVHMTPKEVGGLQSLAMAHGGSLSINPNTGLPEAGFLSNILPTLVGAGVGIATANPALGAMAGGAMGLATSGGNINKGIMAGLGAWGGASIGASLMTEGAAALGAEALPGAMEAGSAALNNPELGSLVQGTVSPQQLSQGVASGLYTPEQAAEYGKAFSNSFSPNTGSTLSAGMSQIAKSPGSFLTKNAFPIGAAVLPMLLNQNQNQYGIPSQTTPAQIRPYTYAQTQNPNWGQPGQAYFNQSYTAGAPYTAKDGGIVALAVGGGVGNMYPQSQQEHVNFATPTQMPTSAEVVNADFDQVTNPYTGDMPRFAEGGISDVDVQPLAPATNKYTLAPQVPSQAVVDYNKQLAARANEEYNINPAPANMLTPGGQDLSRQSSIAGLYQNILGRAPDTAGQDYWASQLKKGASVDAIKQGLMGSQEYLTAHPEYANTLIGNTYQSLLGRAPDQGGQDYYTNLLKSGTSINDISAGIKQSQEYQKLHPTVAAAPVTNTTATGGVTQADIDAYMAANPTAAKTYNAATQTYTTVQPSMGAVQAWKELQASTGTQALQDRFNEMMRAYQQSQQPSGMSASGGLMPGALKYAGGGGISNLGGYSDGGRLLKGPGDGVSDNIPAMIGEKQPARLADGEFVVPARIVSELGNGSTDAGAQRLYAMMDRVQSKRKKSMGKGKFAVDSKAEKDLPV